MKKKEYDLILIDSGVSLYEDEVISFEEINMFPDGKNSNCFHGTSSLRTVANLYPEVKCLSLKITNEFEESSTKRLIKSLEFVKDVNCKVILIAFSCLERDKELEKICDELMKAGKVIIAPLFNGFEESYPACYSSVIGVRGARLTDDSYFRFFIERPIQGVFNSSSSIQIIRGKSYIFSGNSRASALATGEILNVCNGDKKISKEKIEEILCSNSDFFGSRIKYSNEVIRIAIENEIEKIKPGTVKECIYQKDLFLIGFGKQEIIKLIDRIIEIFPISKNYQIYVRDISTFEDIVAFVERGVLDEKCSTVDKKRTV